MMLNFPYFKASLYTPFELSTPEVFYTSRLCLGWPWKPFYYGTSRDVGNAQSKSSTMNNIVESITELRK